MLTTIHMEMLFVPPNPPAHCSPSPQIGACSAFLAAFGTISVWTFPWRSRIPKTIVLPPAPRPFFPRTRHPPKEDSSTSTSPEKGDEASQSWTIRGLDGDYDTAEQGYLHCGPSGSGHFVKMVHNWDRNTPWWGLRGRPESPQACRRRTQRPGGRCRDGPPLGDPEHYQYDIDISRVAEVWRRGSVVASWLLDLIANNALHQDPELSRFAEWVSDSGEGRWTCLAAIETGTPGPLLTTALYERFGSRGEADFANQLLAAMHYQFGGHSEKQD